MSRGDFMDNRYNRHNRRKYSLKVHIVLVTKYRKQLLKGSISDDVKRKIFDIASAKNYEIIAMETDKDHIPFLLSYNTTDRVSNIVATIKQQTAYGRNTKLFYPDNIGRRNSFGLTDILPVA